MTAFPPDLERLLAEEPFVRRLAQHLVGGAAEDVVQQTWLRVLEARPGLLQKPRQWLARVVHRLAIDGRRRDRRRAERERVATPVAVPSPCELLAVEEARRELVAAVNALPEAMRTVVLLRFYDGLPPRRIAEQLGVTASAVSNRLHDALQELRCRLRRRDGDSRAWSRALAPLAIAPCRLPWRELAASSTSAAGLGVIAMTTKTKIVAAAVVALVVALTIAAWPAIHEPVSPPAPATPRPEPAFAALPANAAEPVPPATAVQRDPVLVPPASVARTGSLVVQVRYGDEPQVASGVTVCVGTSDFARRIAPRALTDDSGIARFDALLPGPVDVYTAVRPNRHAFPTVVAGQETRCTLQLDGGITISGVVVDASGLPVGGAILETTLPHFGTTVASPGVAAADGSFTLRQCETPCLIGARAPGFAAPKMYLVQGRAGSAAQVRIELLPGGGCVAGRVVAADGTPVANAVVRVGDGRTEALREDDSRRQPVPAQVATDADGRFFAVGVPSGEQPVQARAPGLAPWRGTVEVAAGGTVHVPITLVQGYTCRGFVKDENGGPLAGVRVAVEYTEFARVAAESGGDGSFTLVGVPAGEATLTSWHRVHGAGSMTVHGAAGQVVDCDMVMSKGIVVRGRVVDDLGAPVARIQVDFEAPGVPQWRGIAFTDGEGGFAANHCPFDQLLVARITTREHVPLVQRAIDPRAGKLVLKLMRESAAPARIVGRVLLADGKPAAGEQVSAGCMDARRFEEQAAVGSDGWFVVEVPSGTWMFAVAATAHASFRSEQRRLEAGGTWDVGTVQLERGGTLRVNDGDGPALSYRITRPDGAFVADLRSPVPPQRSDALQAGEYVLLVRGENVVARAIPFTARSGEETVVDVQRVTGVRQRFTFAGGRVAKQKVTAFEVRSDGRLVAACGAALDALWFAPGDYSLHVRSGDVTTTVPFTVISTELPPVRIALP